jgi:hypothetical protein
VQTPVDPLAWAGMVASYSGVQGQSDIAQQTNPSLIVYVGQTEDCSNLSKWDNFIIFCR